VGELMYICVWEGGLLGIFFAFACSFLFVCA